MKKIIVTEAQLQEFVDNKKAEKIFYEIVEKIHLNEKYLTENIDHNKANKTIIESYKNKKLFITVINCNLGKYFCFCEANT